MPVRALFLLCGAVGAAGFDFVLYDHNAWWERDFLLLELFTGYTPLFTNASFDFGPKLSAWSQLPLSLTRNCAIVFSSNTYTYPAIRAAVQHLQPVLMVHLSDEWGDRSDFDKLTRYAPVFRQYRHAEYPTRPCLLHHIPLGYISGFRTAKNAEEGDASVDSHHFAQRFSGRQFAWSFVGTVKQDRQLMLDTMASVGPHAIETNGTSPTRMHDIYARSIYVPAGRVTRLPALPPPMGRV